MIFSRLTRDFAVVLAVIGCMAYFYHRGKVEGRSQIVDSIVTQAAESRAKTAREVEELRNEIDSLRDDDLLDRLSEWLLPVEGTGSGTD